ncbi:uncharacterized protein LOC117900360 [Drosophila subobscura]|uniref:uncharacterized protein LOC117900360 n=1 Tax=Drosophila subobscura TaxID=7241 RepID=UPI00155A9080|nr:uncharacterized protein LOC117900360 [Drosophila subobscura]
MQNLIKSPALLSILKYPPANFHIPTESVEARDVAVKSGGSGVIPLNANACVFVPRSVAVKADSDVDHEQLKRHFESKDAKKQKTQLTLPWKGFPKRPDKAGNPTLVTAKIDEDYAFEIKSVGKRVKRENSSAEEKPLRTEKAATTEAVPSASEELALEEKRLEHGRKVALEALKLVEQRRARGSFVDTSKEVAAGEVVRHISYSPVRFTPEEKVRVDKLRASKKERIERVLKEMAQKKKPMQLKPIQQKPQKEKPSQANYQNDPKFVQVTKHDSNQLQKDIQHAIFKPKTLNQALQQEKGLNKMTQEKLLKRDSFQPEMSQQQQQEKPPPQRMIQKRYFGLQRATAINAQMEPVVQKEVKTELKPEVKTEVKTKVKTEVKTEAVVSAPARRYIPTTKEWDEKCRLRQLERLKTADKENEKAKSSPNTAVTSNKPFLWRADSNRPLTESNSAKNPTEMIKFGNPQVAAVIPRYVPPIPRAEPAELALARLLQTEKRRGNLTYAQALLSRPPVQFEPSSKYYPVCNIIRYTVEELLMLEPQPEQMQPPKLNGTSPGLGCFLE